MPKSKRAKVVHTTQVTKKTREHKDKLFELIRDTASTHSFCFVLSVENVRNIHIQEIRQEFGDSRLFFGKTKLISRALCGPNASTEHLPGLISLSPHLVGTVGILFTSRPPQSILSYFSALHREDFARTGTVSPLTFTIPPGTVRYYNPYAADSSTTDADGPAALPHTLEPELRRLGVPVRMLKGKIVLGGDEAGEGSEGYVVCKEGEVLDSRQARLAKMFGVHLAEFKVKVVAYWGSESGEVTVVEEGEGDKMDTA